jgi:hypothetical protein
MIVRGPRSSMTIVCSPGVTCPPVSASHTVPSGSECAPTARLAAAAKASATVASARPAELFTIVPPRVRRP